MTVLLFVIRWFVVRFPRGAVPVLVALAAAFAGLLVAALLWSLPAFARFTRFLFASLLFRAALAAVAGLARFLIATGRALFPGLLFAALFTTCFAGLAARFARFLIATLFAGFLFAATLFTRFLLLPSAALGPLLFRAAGLLLATAGL